MGKIVKDESGNSYTAPATSPSMIDNLVAAVQAPMLKSTEGLDANSARLTAGIYGLAGVALGSIIARRRQQAGAEPILKFFF